MNEFSGSCKRTFNIQHSTASSYNLKQVFFYSFSLQARISFIQFLTFQYNLGMIVKERNDQVTTGCKFFSCV